jgi:hypothetical protein
MNGGWWGALVYSVPADLPRASDLQHTNANAKLWNDLDDSFTSYAIE